MIGIPTTYRSANFRSRLEARWASFFDLIGWSWVYEPLDANGYIPDFLVQGAAPFVVEVGPCATFAGYQEKGEKARLAWPVVPTPIGPDGDRVMYDVPEWWTLVVGLTPAYKPEHWRVCALGFFATMWRGTLPEAEAAGQPVRCIHCHKLAVWAMVPTGLMPCGHDYWGPDYGSDASAASAEWVPAGELSDLWAEAGNRVQWKAPA